MYHLKNKRVARKIIYNREDEVVEVVGSEIYDWLSH